MTYFANLDNFPISQRARNLRRFSFVFSCRVYRVCVFVVASSLSLSLSLSFVSLSLSFFVVYTLSFSLADRPSPSLYPLAKLSFSSLSPSLSSSCFIHRKSRSGPAQFQTRSIKSKVTVCVSSDVIRLDAEQSFLGEFNFRRSASH